MKLANGQKIALVSIGFVLLQSAVAWGSYTFGSNDGFRAARVGYMKAPTENGTITLNEKGEVKFKPFFKRTIL